MKHDKNYQKAQVEDLLLFIDRNAPRPQQPFGDTTRLFREKLHGCFAEVTENLITFRGVAARKYREWLLERLLEPQDFAGHGFCSEVWLRLNSGALFGEEADALEEQLAALEGEGFSAGKIYGRSRNPARRQQLMRDCLQHCELFAEGLHELMDFVRANYEICRKVRFIGMKEEYVISMDLLRDYQEEYEAYLRKFAVGYLRPENLPQLEDYLPRLEMSFRNLQMEMYTNFYRLRSKVTYPYLLHLLDYYEHAEFFVCTMTDQQCRGLFPGLPANHEQLSKEEKDLLWQQLRDAVLLQLEELVKDINFLLELQKNCPYDYDLNDPKALTPEQLLMAELLDDADLWDRYHEDPEEVVEELAQSLGLSELELHLCLLRLKNEEDWTDRDYEDFGVACEYLERMEWEEKYEDFLGEEERSEG